MYYKVLYDGFDLSKYIYIKRIKPITANRTASFTSHEYNSGRRFRNVQDAGLDIEIEAVIREDVLNARDELVKILYSAQEPKELIISDQPNRKLMCIFTGNLDLTSRVRHAGLKLRFSSPYPYWISTERPVPIAFDAEGKVTVDNKGTYRTAPRLDVTFDNECGYVSIISPGGHIGLGNAKELDRVPVPPTENMMNERPVNINNGWTYIQNFETYVTDYIKMTSKGKAKTNETLALTVDKTTYTGLKDSWQGFAISKMFSAGSVEQEANNFSLTARVQMQDFSGKSNRTCAMLIVIEDETYTPIMTTSIYDVSSDQNKLNTSFKINSLKGDRYHSTIIHKGSLPSLNGQVEMKKIGNKFTFQIRDMGETITYKRDTDSYYSVGDIVTIRPEAKYGYDEANNAHSIKDWTRGRQYEIVEKRLRGGWWQYNIAYNGVKTYWVYYDAIYGDRTPRKVSTGPRIVSHEVINDSLAQFKPARVSVWMASWGDSTPYSKLAFQSIFANRIYTVDSLDIENVFRPGDVLTIDNQTGDILLNGDTFQGNIDSDSQFFKLDYGKSELRLHKSAWAAMPKAHVMFEERFG